MITVVKNVTNIKNIYTYYEFENFNSWDDFDVLIFKCQELGFKINNTMDGIYSRYCDMAKDDFEFSLMYHEDFGNCLYSKIKQDTSYYDRLESIAFEILQELNGI